MRALIVESGATRGALAGARALHEAGWAVGVGTPTGNGIASSSRAVAQRHKVPAPGAGLERFLDAVAATTRDGSYEIVFGAGDAEVLALSAGRDRLGALVPYASDDRVVRAHDKLELHEAALAAGLASPRTVTATAAAIEQWRPPYIVKPSLHAPAGDSGPARVEAELVADAGAAEQRVAEIRAAGRVPLLQERIRGSLLAVAAVTRADGSPAAVVAQRAERIKADVGVSVRAQTVSPQPALMERAGRLLAGLGWFGLAQLQFLVPDDGEPHLIDFNGRFYGSLSLALAAGVNLPATWAALATEAPVSGLSQARTDVRYQWLEGDLRRAWRERRPGLGRDLLATARYAMGATHSIWSPMDPMPLAHRLGAAVGKGLRRRARRA